MRFKIVISDRAFNIIDEMQDKAFNVSWEYNRVGGCGAFSFDIPERYCRETTLGILFNVKIYTRSETDRAFTLRYQGRIENKIASVRDQQEIITVRGMGYQVQLSHIYVDRDYTIQEISTIVTDILDNDITSNTDISYDVGDITATTFTADSYSVNSYALNAFQDLATLFGTREWGVDKDRKFFFKARSTSVGFRVPLGRDLINFSSDTSGRDIFNRIIVNGDGGFQRTINDTASQTKYGRHDFVVQNTAITTNDVADQFGNAILAEHKSVVRRARVTLLDDQMFESTVPIGLFQMRPRLFTWGERNWGTFLWSGYIEYQVNRISYLINEEGVLMSELQLGQLRPNIAENISQLEYQIDQLRQVGV